MTLLMPQTLCCRKFCVMRYIKQPFMQHARLGHASCVSRPRMFPHCVSMPHTIVPPPPRVPYRPPSRLAHHFPHVIRFPGGETSLTVSCFVQRRDCMRGVSCLPKIVKTTKLCKMSAIMQYSVIVVKLSV